jgi:hypothetical protein
VSRKQRRSGRGWPPTIEQKETKATKGAGASLGALGELLFKNPPTPLHQWMDGFADDCMAA